nr:MULTISPECIES: hypothetical protein [Ralstonia solanacearum species complex]
MVIGRRVGWPPPEERVVETCPASTYKGYDIYPLILRFDPPREWYERRPDRSYSASVMICDEGISPSARNARVYGVRVEQWDSVDCAKRAAIKTAEDIIDGVVAAVC